MNSLIWILLIIAFIVIESATVSLISIWFAGGALVALLALLLGADVTIQILVFLLVSVLCIVLLRKFALNSVKNKKSKTNIDRIIGQEIILKEGISDELGAGLAIINDVEWKVKSENGELIPAGEKVKVVDVEGVKLVVKR
ncbi:MAG: NfeD family protein [Clostridia bacterium]|nr:NfeD family protein [Clostridia bacterium]